MTTFGFVHGAYHGSWCWQPLITELEHRGHHGLAVDLPCEDPRAGAIEYAAAAVEAFADAGPDLVVVGHSLGGLSIPLIAERRPVARLVYLCAMMPRLGRAHDVVMREEPDMVGSGPEGGAYVDENGASRWRSEAAASWFFADCQPEVASWAASKFRGQFWRITAGSVSPSSVARHALHGSDRGPRSGDQSGLVTADDACRPRRDSDRTRLRALPLPGGDGAPR